MSDNRFVLTGVHGEHSSYDRRWATRKEVAALVGGIALFAVLLYGFAFTMFLLGSR